jgi:transposase-like protein
MNKKNENIKCPTCKGNNIEKLYSYEKKGKYYCKECKKEFFTNKKINRAINPGIIAFSISYYNLGNSLDDTVNHINDKFKLKIQNSTVEKWIEDFLKICNNKKIRSTIVNKYKDNIINSFSFRHSDIIYNFKYHKPKLEMLCSDFPTLANYIKNLKNECPADFFENNGKNSQLNLDVTVSEEGKYNLACQLADFSLNHSSNAIERHSLVEKFMLINDCSTIACEVPVWFWEKYLDMGISGHIDVLQIRKGNIYLLDYQPDARRENKKEISSKLFLYASGLSFRTKIPLMKFRCAWFDQNNYYEFNPEEQNFSVKIKNKLYFRKI